ncbi:MAG: malonyl-CoA synthase [Pseudomonadota bacterium]
MPNPLYDALLSPHLGQETPFLTLTDGGPVSHDRFLKLSAQISHALVAEGAKTGDRVAVQVAKSPEALAIYAACIQAGLIFLPLNTAYTPAEVDYFVDNAEARLLICDPSAERALAPIAHRVGAKTLTLASDGAGSLLALAADQPQVFDTVDRVETDLAAFLYTSGTTGRSKGAMLSQGNLLSNAQTLVDYWRFTQEDILLHALPIFHTHGLFVASNIQLLTGGQMIFLSRFDTDEVIRWMPKATTMMGVPTFYTRLLADPRFTGDLTAHMRLFISGSAPLLAETHHQFEERTGHRILERYGMTETNMNTSNPYEGDRRAGTVGHPLPGVEIKITDPSTGAIMPDGETGQIEVRGPNVFQGYWRMPEKTREELRDDGFFITGDVGVIGPDGYVQIVGRGKDLIISGGFNIYPKEIEQILDTQDGVSESAVIGVHHPDFGESPIGILVAEGAGPDVSDIDTKLRDQLARFKQPKMLIVVDELPRNTMGKVQKNILRERYKDAFQ